MIMIFLPALLLISTTLDSGQDQPSRELRVVPIVDLIKYSGLWYEIARLPNKFQKQCIGDVTATYTVLDDGSIKVVNCCRDEDGELAKAEGKAKRSDGETSNAKLKVRFAPAILSFLPFVWGDYWIIDVAPDYSYAVIGEPSRKYLWVLSRVPVMDEAEFNTILLKVKANGYDLEGLIRTKQSITQ